MKMTTRVLALTLGVVAVAPMTFAAEATFDIGAKIYASIDLKNDKAMAFPDHEIVTANTNVTVAPTDAGAAHFSATGDTGRAVTGSVTTSSVNVSCTTGACTGDTMVVDSFTYGGDMDATGASSFVAPGTLNRLYVGATQHITTADRPGTYAGQGTFSLVYS